MKTVSFTALLLAAAAPALAVAPSLVTAQASAAPEAVQAGTYKVESNHTLAQFAVNHFGFNDFFGTIPGATGSLSLDPKALAATTLDVSLPVARIATTNDTLDEELRSADWFDAATYPTIRFVSRKVEQTGPRTARISGTVTLHGVTKPMVLDATFGGAGVNPMNKAYTIGFSATGTLKRSEFGVSKYVPAVSDDVQVRITAAFEKTS
ncbi:YceI family protein [Novosphingobium aerophilum]|uniref:YceI family protein n=1 Tax=Novosphingobium TaxID=165696 RepID=UPI0006C8BE40|nr:MULTISPECIES: YceI family protein [unclassified Novosphingobium]KPH65335.1 polyisoprenoid-binding protein [Novosphingobium sp. ST904]TCM30729.1 polyisoprenoid-binding protein YceI [Novosphingobium sp. ST904]WRT94770.1 YceI family protein [Novosphingobium sp. RL4]